MQLEHYIIGNKSGISSTEVDTLLTKIKTELTEEKGSLSETISTLEVKYEIYDPSTIKITLTVGGPFDYVLPEMSPTEPAIVCEHIASSFVLVEKYQPVENIYSTLKDKASKLVKAIYASGQDIS